MDDGVTAAGLRKFMGSLPLQPEGNATEGTHKPPAEGTCPHLTARDLLVRYTRCTAVAWAMRCTAVAAVAPVIFPGWEGVIVPSLICTCRPFVKINWHPCLVCTHAPIFQYHSIKLRGCAGGLAGGGGGIPYGVATEGRRVAQRATRETDVHFHGTENESFVLDL